MDHSEDSESETHGIVKLEGNLLENGHQEENGILLEDDPSPDKLNSIFSLTLQEFQLRSGKSFGSMNIDELLNSVWAMEGQEQNQNQNQNQNGRNNNGGNGVILPQQGGSFTIPTPLCNKTVQEVWAEIQGSQENNPANFIANGRVSGGTQVTFGDITLKDFLVKVGVIDDDGAQVPLANNSTSMNFSSGSTSFHTNNNIITDQPMMDNYTAGGVLVYASNSLMFAPNEYFVGESSNGNMTPINGYVTDESTTRSLLARQRRQRRMIKNRESAARSRARRQAYTAELEIELNQLSEENARLRLILQEEAQNEQSQEVLMNQNLSANVQIRAMDKWKALRRTKSLGW